MRVSTIVPLIIPVLLVLTFQVGADASRRVEQPAVATAKRSIDSQPIAPERYKSFETASNNGCPPSPARCTWQHTYGGMLEDKAYGVATTSQDGVVVAGHTRSLSGHQYDGWLLHLDRSGDTLWERRLGGPLTEHAYGTVVMGDKIVMAGLTRSRARGDSDAWVVCLDLTGKTLWERILGDLGNDKARTVATTGDGHILVAGTSQQSGSSNDDGWLMQLRQDGTVLWENRYGGPEDNGIFHVTALMDGGIAAVGYADKGGEESYQLWILRLDAKGNKLWERFLGHGQFDAGTSVVATSDGGLIVAGTTSADAFQRDDAWVLRFEADGRLAWEKVFEGEGRDGAWAIAAMPQGIYVIAAATASYGAGSTDAWLVAIDDQGEVQWERIYGGPLWDRPTSLAVTTDGGGLILGGYTTSSGAGYEDYWILRLDENGKL